MGESDNIVDRLRALRRFEVRFQLLQEQQNTMNNMVANMQEQQELAQAEQQAAERKTDASARALSEVWVALSFPVDIVNRSLLFTSFLEKEGKINKPQIIRFLQDHAQNMERTRDNMQTLVSNMKPA